MIQGYGPVTQALLGTLFTWGLTALGSAMVIFLRGNQVKEKLKLKIEFDQCIGTCSTSNCFLFVSFFFLKIAIYSGSH